MHEPTLATDIGPITFEETVFVNDPAPNARHFFGPDFDLFGQPLLTDEQPLANSEDSDSDPEPVNQAVDPDIVLVQEGVEGQQDRLPTSPRAADPVDSPAAEVFIRAEEMTAPAHGECGRRPSEMVIGGAESGAAAPGRAYEELFQHWLKTRADTAERAVDQHRGMVSDQPLLAIPTRAPVRDDLATMLEQLFQRLDQLEAPSHHSGGRGGGRGRSSQRCGRGRSNSFVRRCLICKSEEHLARNCPKAQEEQKTGGNRSTPPDSKCSGVLQRVLLKCIAPVATEVAPPIASPAETPATEAPTAETLNIDFGNLVTEMVSCCGVEVRAVIDTGAGISIVFPREKRPRDGPGMRLIEPIPTLLLNLGVAAGRALVDDDIIKILWIKNFSQRPQVLVKGTVVALATAVSGGDIAVAENMDLVRIAAVLETPVPPVAARELAPKPALDFENQINKELGVADRNKVLNTLSQFTDCFATSNLDLGKTDVIEFSIETGDAQPIYQVPFSSAWKERRTIRDQVAEMLKQDVIEPSTSPWSSP